MKKLLYIFLGFGLFFSCSENKENDLDKVNLKGNVKSVFDISFEAVEKFGKITKGAEITYSNHDIYKRERTVYNDKGNKIEKDSHNNSQGSLTHKDTFEYDDKGNQIEWRSYVSDGSLQSKVTYRYDDKGNIIENRTINSDGNLNDGWTYEYDDKGNHIKSRHYYDSFLNNLDNFTYEHDDKGNVIEFKKYNKDGELNYKQKNRWNDKGNLIEYSKYDKDGKLTFRRTIQHDKGNIIERKDYDKKNKLKDKTNYEYKFDDKENWIQKIIFKNDKVTHIVERDIDYFKL